jgi:hypothetical protein
MQQLDTAGSTLYKLTWKRKATPLGRRYLERAASVLHTGGSGFGSWPTPNAIPPSRGGLQSDPEAALKRRAQGHMLNLDDAATLASWATPAERDHRFANAKPFRERGGGSKGEQLNNQAAHLASWPTPMAGTPAQKGYNEAGNTDSGRRTVELCAWPTPQAHDVSTRGNTEADHHHSPHDTSNAAELCATDVPARLTASGEPLTGYIAKMEGGGQLCPSMSGWLMGFPPIWDQVAIAAMDNVPRRRKKG